MSILSSSLLPSEYQEYTLESIASDLLYFEASLQLAHWQTSSYAQHNALGMAYELAYSFRDEVIEKLMGSTGKRPQSIKVRPIKSVSVSFILDEFCEWFCGLAKWAKLNELYDIENIAYDAEGKVNKIKYLLTLT